MLFKVRVLYKSILQLVALTCISIPPGNEYSALFLSTTEPTKEDGSTCNPTKSICDPFVFNTVMSRARIVVVSVGNPFTLLRKESHMVQRYGDRGKCWSNYLKLCLDNDTMVPDPSLGLKDEEWKWRLRSLQRAVDEMVTVTKQTTVDLSESVVPNLKGNACIIYYPLAIDYT